MILTRPEQQTAQADVRRPLIVVVDATNQGHIVWHGSRGQCDVASVLLARCQSMRAEWSAERLLCAFDSGQSFRKTLDPNYKAHRTPTPDKLREQLAAAAGALSDAGFPMIGGDGFEADDAIATACQIGRKLGYRVVVVSTDKDVRQCLLAGEVTIADKISISRGKLLSSFVTANAIFGRYGVHAQQWIDYQCLVGDGCDGIRGADGIGPTIAAKLLAVGSTLEELLENPWKYATQARVRDSLFEFRNRAPVVKQLVTLRTDVPFVEECFL